MWQEPPEATYAVVLITMKMTPEDEEGGFGSPSLWLNPHLWREILLNVSPTDSYTPLKDRYGRDYWLETEHLEGKVGLHIYRRGGELARAIVAWDEPEKAVLEDLIVASPYRGAGLGKDLLRRAIVLARFGGAKHLTGRVIRKDMERNPRLLEWYRRYGFRVEPMQSMFTDQAAHPISRAARRSMGAYETVATISLDL